MSKLEIDQIAIDLKKMISGEVLVDKTTRAIYSTDASIYQVEPLGVVIPKNKKDVKRVIKYAFDNNISILPRGSGSGLAGQSLGQGLVLDFTKHMNQIKEINLEDSYVRIEPGITLGVLNQELNNHDKIFPPDPSSGDYCTLGGMLASNASGGHSVKYGSTIDYVLELEVLLANGEDITVKKMELDSQQYIENKQQSGLTGEIYDKIASLLTENQDIINDHTPNAPKDCSGYRLDVALQENELDLAKLLVGSEGTLAVITEAKLKIIDTPASKAIALLYFDDLDKAGKAVGEVLNLNPSAIEIMDYQFLDLVRENHADIDKLLPNEIETALLVEVDGDNQNEIEDRIAEIKNLIYKELELAFKIHTAYEEAEQKKLWSIRKSAVPILNKLKGPKRITGFVEDVAVDPFKLPEYIRRFREIVDKHEVKAIIYGHAGHGNTHPRPLLNLKTEDDIKKMESIAKEVYELVDELNGTISGEHGDGLLRTQFLNEFHGPLYELFKDVKNIFDSKNILNPGKIINDDSKLMVKNLRYGSGYSTINMKTNLNFALDEYQAEVEKCHGCSKCRSLVGTDMCPVFKAIGDERAAPKSKANILRAIISGKLDSNEHFWTKEFKELFDLCLNCKNCYLECPSQVNIPKLMMEARAKYYKKVGQPLVNKLLGAGETMGRLGSMTPTITNNALRIKPFRKIMEKTAGFSAERKFPKFANQTFEKWFNKKKLKGSKKVAYFTGCSTNFYNPAIGKSMVKVLEKNEYQVILPKQKCCGIPKMNYGDIDSARANINYNIESLSEIIKDGYDIIVDCPSCSLSLKEEYLDIVDSQEARLVAQHTYHINEYLLMLNDKDNLNLDLKTNQSKYAYHTPCHLKAQGLSNTSKEVLELIPGVKVSGIDAGCCGIAGTFGFKKDNYQLSMKIGKNIFEKLEKMDYNQVLTDCDACGMQLNQGTDEEIMHPIQILANSY
ncbi:anaerobic glycerol-3-phosphate dehydrogenase subunit C [Selenihalanaerobacter shriftii]|uniref:Glycerol-3-phosphate dehydrogenase, anaerobic, C subunit n=1 Tax=Selenihalanaerobacter shriftii TaxID=142842 RepID=A0A1T4Q633_9FIRM|nr:anaerobic glycerol-3-phosphate dehydrogenase subunit C [Selenihalanaerobacter shriftii]SJZ99215.1 glycerol-3-phosphate dehydrogenase, anaerobic, C subunit [Selenihalanaerobacter shriftii]